MHSELLQTSINAWRNRASVSGRDQQGHRNVLSCQTNSWLLNSFLFGSDSDVFLFSNYSIGNDIPCNRSEEIKDQIQSLTEKGVSAASGIDSIKRGLSDS